MRLRPNCDDLHKKTGAFYNSAGFLLSSDKLSLRSPVPVSLDMCTIDLLAAARDRSWNI